MSTRPVAAFLLALTAFGQTPATGPRFEAASIRPATVSGPRGRGARGVIDASRVELLGTTLPQLIRRAYRLEPYQNVTGPDWTKKMYYDVFASLPMGGTKEQVPEMLQVLLADQLQLVIRRESLEQPVCVLSVGKGGPKLKEVPADLTPEAVLPHSDGRTAVLRTKSADGYLTYSRLNGTVVLDTTKISMHELAIAIGKEVGLPVFDRTGLKGFYEVSLFVPGTLVKSGAPKGEREDSWTASDPEGVNIYKSIQRLGLKLEKTKAPIEYLVVEHAEQIPIQR